MADAGLNAIEKALFARLNEASVTTLVPATQHYNSVVRPGGVYPCITVAYMDSRDDSGFASEAETLDYVVRGYTAGSYTLADVTDIAEAIDARLRGATLAPTGYTGGVYGIRRVRWLRGIEYDEARNPYPFAGAVYRLWTQRS